MNRTQRRFFESWTTFVLGFRIVLCGIAIMVLTFFAIATDKEVWVAIIGIPIAALLIRRDVKAIRRQKSDQE